MAVNHEQIKFPRMPRGRNQMPYFQQCPDNEMPHMQRGHCFPDAYGGKMDGPCGMGVSEFKSPMMNPDPPPQPAKKKRRTSNAMAAAAQSNSSPVIPDLLPPPLTDYGDTIVASNPFDDTPPVPSMSHMNSMNHVNKHMGVGQCLSPAGNPMMGSMSPCHIVGSSMPCGPPVGSPINCGPPMGNCSPMSGGGGNANCGPIGSPLASCNSRQVSRSPLICTPMSNNSVMGNSGMNPMNRSPSSMGSPLGSVMSSNVRGNSPLDCGLAMSSVGSQKNSPMSVLGSHNMNNLNCGSPMGSPSNMPMSSCNNGSMIGSPITSPLSIPCSMGGGSDLNPMNMGNVMNRSPMNAGPNSVMCNSSMRGPSPIGGGPMMNCSPGMGLGPKSDMNMNELALREGHMSLKPHNGPGGCGMPSSLSGPQPPDMGCGPMTGMHCNPMISNQCPPGMNNVACIGGNMNRGQCGPGPGPGPGPGHMVMNSMYEGMGPQCRPTMNRSQFPRGVPGIGYNGGMNPMSGQGPGPIAKPNMNMCGPPDMIMGCGPNSGVGNPAGMHCSDGPMNNLQCMGPNMNQCFNSQFNPFDVNNSRCSPNLPFSTNDMSPLSSNSHINSICSMPSSSSGGGGGGGSQNNNNFYRTNMSCMSSMGNVSSTGGDSLSIGHSIMSTVTMKNDCMTVDSDLNSLACSMTSSDPTDELSLLDENLLRDSTTSASNCPTMLKSNDDRKATSDLLLDDAALGVDMKNEHADKSKLADSDMKVNESKELKVDGQLGKDSCLAASPTIMSSVTRAGTPSTSTAPTTSTCSSSCGRSSTANAPPLTNSSGGTAEGANTSSDSGNATKMKCEVDDNLSGASNSCDKSELANEDHAADEKKKEGEEKLLEGDFGSQDKDKSRDAKGGGSVETTLKVEESASDQCKDSLSVGSASVKLENDDFFEQNVKKNKGTNNGRTGGGNAFSNASANTNFSVATTADMSMMNNTTSCSINDNSMCGSPMLPSINRLPITSPHGLNQPMNYPNKANMNLYPGRVYPHNKSKLYNIPNTNAVTVHTCGQCHKELKDTDDFVMCESGCNVWYHRICVGLTEDAYLFIREEVYAEWVCDKCLQTRQVPLVKMKS